MEIITTSSRGQIVIPDDVRKRHDIKEGTKLILHEHGDKIILEKAEKLSTLLKQGLHAEESGWDTLSEASLREVWDNEDDEHIWEKYL